MCGSAVLRVVRGLMPALLLLAVPAAQSQHRELRAGPTTQPASGPAVKPGLAALAGAESHAQSRRTFVVARVLDGTSLRVAGETAPVVLGGVVVPPGDAAAQERAAAFLTALLEGEAVQIEELPRIGRAARGNAASVCAIVRRAPDGLCANVEAVRQGFARFDDDESIPGAAAFRDAEHLARRARKGIWSDGAARAQPPEAPDPQNVRPDGAPAGAEPPAGGPSVSVRDMVYVTRTGTKYHRRACPYCRSGGTALTLAEARERKLLPCGRCKPDE